MPITTETPADSIKAFINTISPFITLAFGLIAFIYTRELSQTQAIFLEMKTKMEERDRDAARLSNAVIIQDGKIGRLEKDAEHYDSRITSLEQQQNDLEKTFILSNANRK